MKRTTIGVIGLVVGLAAASSARAEGPRRWKIEPPPGWIDISAEVSRREEFLAQKAAMEPLGFPLEVVAYKGADGDEIDVVHGVAQKRWEDSAAMLRGWEQGARTSMAKLLPEVSYYRRASTKAVAIDTVGASSEVTLYTRRIAGFDLSMRLVGVAAMCRGPESVCLAATHSLAFDESALRDLPTDSPPASADAAYRIGQLVGASIVFAALGIWLWNRRAKKRTG